MDKPPDPVVRNLSKDFDNAEGYCEQLKRLYCSCFKSSHKYKKVENDIESGIGEPRTKISLKTLQF